MSRNVVMGAALVGLAFVVLRSMPDVTRYLKMRMM
jgi:hypothetical protein